MSDTPLERLLGSGESDPGCDGAAELQDLYCDALRRGEDVSIRFAEFVAHIRNCAACREDTEGMLAALEGLEGPGQP
jgi:hypothetical protein